MHRRYLVFLNSDVILTSYQLSQSLTGSGVRYSVPWGKKYYFENAPTLNKTTEYEVKNRCKSAEEVKTEHLLQFCSFFEGNKPHLALEMNLTKL